MELTNNNSNSDDDTDDDNNNILIWFAECLIRIAMTWHSRSYVQNI